MSTERRLTFGEAAGLYERVRPSYPPALVDDVLAFGDLQSGELAVEVGAGTGKATTLFAARGLSILALEPSHAMAEIARRNTLQLPNVAIEEVEFERWTPPRRCRLVYSAQAWHWIDPRIRFVRAAEVLVDDGVLAAFWNRVRWESSPLREALADVYRHEAPELGSAIPRGPMQPAAGDADEPLRDWRGVSQLSMGFTDPEWRTYNWVQTYRAGDYLALLRTHSDHAVLPAPRRAALLNAVGELIEAAGGVIEIEYVTRLGLARPHRGTV